MTHQPPTVLVPDSVHEEFELDRHVRRKVEATTRSGKLILSKKDSALWIAATFPLLHSIQPMLSSKWNKATAKFSIIQPPLPGQAKTLKAGHTLALSVWAEIIPSCFQF